ncbi:MAG: putative ABC transport system ATP-binding protein [Planctomycetota bacterium]|jgi:putative ABC transport system ATP-binding protein
MSSLLRTDGLFKFQGGAGRETPILKDVGLELAEQEFLCVMGPSGSGKTTLLHLLSGLDEPSAGSVELKGQDLARLSTGKRTLLRRQQVGYVFQFFNLLPNLTVAENIGLPVAIAGARPASKRKEIAELAERLGIASRLEAFPHELSGGEMQRTSIARALIGGQPLLLCDEPTGNLAQQAGAEVMALLRQAVDEDGRTVLLVTHNPRDAAFADRVCFLVDGELAPEHELRGPEIRVDDVHAALGRLSI